MRYKSVDQFLKQKRGVLQSLKAAAIILAEDDVAVADTIQHHIRQGFGAVVVLAYPQMELSNALAPNVYRVDCADFRPETVFMAVNKVIRACSGVWLYIGYNAEYLFYPFCETRCIEELVSFQEVEKRQAFWGCVVDLYAGSVHDFPNGVSNQHAYLDAKGYYALPRQDPRKDYAPIERQIDCFGGLRWRHEQHFPWEQRRIDRICLFQSKPGLILHPDWTLNDPEMNTHQCAWHHNISVAIPSFRAAKALRHNPGTRRVINELRWHQSVAFNWSSAQLLTLGLMETGHWF